jgi:hypothetical protein
MSKRWRGCVGALLLAGLTAALLVLTGQARAPKRGGEAEKDRAPQQAVFKGRPHPLDPLSREEMAAAVRVLQGEKKFDEDSRLAQLSGRIVKPSDRWASSAFNDARVGIRKSAFNRLSVEGWLTAYVTPHCYIGPLSQLNTIVDREVRAELGRPTFLFVGLTTGVEF